MRAYLAIMTESDSRAAERALAAESGPIGGDGAYRWWVLVGHALVVSVLSAAFAWTWSTAEEPNIGAGFFLLPLIPLGFPWTALLLPRDGEFLGFDAVVVAAPTLNVVLHLAVVLCWRRRPVPSAPDQRRALGAVCAIIAASVLVVVAIGATAAVSRDRQADAIEAILPVPPWTNTDSGTACVFCRPQSARVDLSGLPAATPPGPELLAGLDARLGQAGYAPDDPWGCEDTSDDERFLDPGQIPPPRLLRICSRNYASDDTFALALVEYLEGNSATAWIDINRV